MFQSEAKTDDCKLARVTAAVYCCNLPSGNSSNPRARANRRDCFRLRYRAAGNLHRPTYAGILFNPYGYRYLATSKRIRSLNTECPEYMTSDPPLYLMYDTISARDTPHVRDQFNARRRRWRGGSVSSFVHVTDWFELRFHEKLL